MKFSKIIIFCCAILFNGVSYGADLTKMNRRTFLLCSGASAASAVLPTSVLLVEEVVEVPIHDAKIYWTGNSFHNLNSFLKPSKKLQAQFEAIARARLAAEVPNVNNLSEVEDDETLLPNVRSKLVRLIRQRGQAEVAVAPVNEFCWLAETILSVTNDDSSPTDLCATDLAR